MLFPSTLQTSDLRQAQPWLPQQDPDCPADTEGQVPTGVSRDFIIPVASNYLKGLAGQNLGAQQGVNPEEPQSPEEKVAASCKAKAKPEAATDAAIYIISVYLFLHGLDMARKLKLC